MPVTQVGLDRNEILYTSGEHAYSLFFVESGAVKTVAHSTAGKDCLLDICVSGGIVGESSLANQTRAETAIAMMPSTVIHLAFDPLLDHMVEVDCVYLWAQYLLWRLRERQEIITSLVTADSEWRLAATLLRLARRLGTRIGGRLRIDLRITHQELSEMVGTTRSRIGHFLKRFRELGLIVPVSGRSLVVYEARLRHYVELGSCGRASQPPLR
ncbi:MAG: Crp/Fnr family transcriptional regulator [Actinobacteria bacterium]|nr:Crp/Fnr family transcriptional regulator [Actinomycetota bacterium]